MFGESILSGLVSGLTNGLFATYGIQQQGKQNAALAAQQNDYNLDMWRLQNEYNSPQAQMQRLAAAGLNPNLMYGMGTTGNASQAPQKNAPAPVDYQKYADDLAKAFNLENLRTIVAHRKLAQAEATMAQVQAADAKDRRSAMRDFGELYAFDPESGRYVMQDLNPDNSVTVTRPMSRAQRIRQEETGSYSNRGFFFQQALADDYTKRALIPFRAKLFGSQSAYLQPQIEMLRYENRFKPYSFWIGQGSRVLNSLPLPSFKFNRNSGSPLSTTYRNEYRYAPQTNYINNHSPF